MKKRLLSMLLAFCMMLTMVPAAFAGDMAIMGESTQLAGGSIFSAIIDSNGGLWTFGYNDVGQLGNGSVSQVVSPTKVKDNICSVSAGSQHLAFIDENGGLWTCGANDSGQLGYAPTGQTAEYSGTSINSTPKKVMDNVVAVSAESDLTAAITEDGTLWTWGADFSGYNTTDYEGKDVLYIDMPGNPNQVATGHYQPIQQMEDVQAVDVSESVVLVLKEDGTLWGFGSNLYGILGNTDSTNVVSASNPIELMDNVVSMAVGDTHAAAVTSDGSLYTWGANAGGQLGLGTFDFEDHPTPTKVMDNVKDVVIGGGYIDQYGAFTAAVTNDGKLYIWGNQGQGIFGDTDNSTTNEAPKVQVMDDVVAVAAGGEHILAQKADGSFWGFGRRAEGQLGNGEFPYDDPGQTTPVQIALGTVAPPEENEPVITIEESKATATVSSDRVSAEDKEALEAVLSNADVAGLKDALNDGNIKQIIQSSGVNTSDDTKVMVQLQVSLNVTAADLDKGTISFEVMSTAKVTAGSETKTVPVDNSYLNGEKITVKLPIPTGFEPEEILHISEGYPIEQYLNGEDFTIKDGVAELNITHFSELRMNESQTTVAKIEGSDTGYFSLQSAIDAAKSGAKINLYRNSDDTVLKVANKSLTISCNSYALRSDVDWQLVGCTQSETKDENSNPVIVITYTGGGSSSSGGGGGSSTTSNLVSVSQNSNGTISVSPSRAQTGDTVTVTIDPDEGYMLDELIVTDRNGNRVSVTRVSDTEYTFTKPSGVVKVEAAFTEDTGEEQPSTSSIPFTDVATTAWYYDAVEYMYESGMMNGTSDTTFSPNATTTRAMIVTMLHRLEGEPDASDVNFTDIASGMYYADAVAWAQENGVVNGTSETTFSPDQAITREQLATILYRYAQVKGYDVTASNNLDAYTDASQISAYALTAMQWANAEGLITGNTATTINPTGDATRAEVATILMRFAENVAQA